VDSVLYLLISTDYDYPFLTPLVLAWCAQASELYLQKLRYQIPIVIFSKASRQ
jgi:hypothetical protein